MTVALTRLDPRRVLDNGTAAFSLKVTFRCKISGFFLWQGKAIQERLISLMSLFTFFSISHFRNYFLHVSISNYVYSKLCKFIIILTLYEKQIAIH